MDIRSLQKRWDPYLLQILIQLGQGLGAGLLQALRDQSITGPAIFEHGLLQEKIGIEFS